MTLDAFLHKFCAVTLDGLLIVTDHVDFGSHRSCFQVVATDFFVDSMIVSLEKPGYVVVNRMIVSLEKGFLYFKLSFDLADHYLRVTFASYLASSHVVR